MKSLWGKFGYDIFTGFKMASPQSWDVRFSHFINWNWIPLSSKSWHFEASEGIMTKFTSQALHVIRIKYQKVCGSGNPSTFIPATRTKHFDAKFTPYVNKAKISQPEWLYLAIKFLKDIIIIKRLWISGKLFLNINLRNYWTITNLKLRMFW